MNIGILLADDHIVVREGLRKVLESEDGFSVVGEAGDGQEAVSLVSSLTPDVAVLDVEMPLLNGIEATRLIKERSPGTSVIFLSRFDQEELVLEGFQAGISGYVLKSSPCDELIWAIKTVKKGLTYLSQNLTRGLISDKLGDNGSGISLEKLLTRREIEVFRLLQRGCSPKEISQKLCISIKTFHTHREHIMSKLKLNSAAELSRYAMLGMGSVPRKL